MHALMKSYRLDRRTPRDVWALIAAARRPRQRLRLGFLLSIGLLAAAGCSTTSPFSTTAQAPVPLGAQTANNVDGAPHLQAAHQPPSPNAAPRQSFNQAGPNAFDQAPVNSGNPLLAGFRSTTAKIGQALAIEPRVIPATDPTSLANEPQDIGADLHFQAAQVYESQQNMVGAITHFQKALAISPREPRILVAFGRLYDRQGELKTAEGLYQQALQINPHDCAALNALGICYAKQGNLDAALAHLARAAQRQPQNARYKNNMANVLADAGRIDEAYAQLVSVHGEAGAHYNLGYLLLQQGKRDEARRELQLALQANPYLEQAHQLLDSLTPPAAPGVSAFQGPARAGSQTPMLGRYSVSEATDFPVANPLVNPSVPAPQGGPAAGVSYPAPYPAPASGPQSLPPL